MERRYGLFWICLPALFLTDSQVHSQSVPSIFISAAIPQGDVIGSKISYFLKEDILKSGRYSVAGDSKHANFNVSLVTIEDDVENDKENSAAYSAVLLAGQTYFVDNVVGTCGTNVPQGCADTVMSSLSSDIDQIEAQK